MFFKLLAISFLIKLLAQKHLFKEVDINTDEDLPVEMIYADDYDHLTEDYEKKMKFKGNVKEILGRYDLKVNEDKTEDTVLRRGKHDKKNKETNEPWRETVKLGSKLGDKEDIKRRKNLATGKMIKVIVNAEISRLSQKR